MNVDIYKKIRDQVDAISTQIVSRYKIGDKIKIGGQIVHEPISVSLSMLLGDNSAKNIDKIVMMYTIDDGISGIIAVATDKEYENIQANDIVIVNGIYVASKLKDSEKKHNLAVRDDINLPIVIIESIEVLEDNDA